MSSKRFELKKQQPNSLKKMVLGTIQLRLHFPMPQSLKEKRSILKSVLTRIRQTFNIGLAEIDGMDLWQYSVIAAVCVGRERREVEKTLDQVREFLDREEELQVVDEQKELL